MKAHIIIVSFLLVSGFLSGQGMDLETKRERIQAMKIAFITEKLQLTPEEAQRFWPVFNEFDDKRRNLEMEISDQVMDKRPDIALMSDEEVDLFIQQRLNREEQILDLKKEYYTRFKEVISVKKVFRLFEAEAGFKKLLLERLQEGHGPERNPPPR